MKIRCFATGDKLAIINLWRRCELLRSHNDPDSDIEFALASENAEILVGDIDGHLNASIMVGHDGHRGWYYYVAVDPELRQRGCGLKLLRTAERWLYERGVKKVQLMVRDDNLGVKDFYARAGYQPNPCHLMQRWLVDCGAPRIDGREDGMLDVTITYLEMTQAPALPQAHPPHDRSVALLRAHKPTIAFYRFLYDRVGAPWLWWARRRLDDDGLRQIIHDPQVEIYVLYVEGTPAGFAEMHRRDKGVVDLSYFGLMPEFIGGGFGPYLLHSVIEIAWSHEPKRVIVDTCTLDHPKALPLYQRYGFQPYRQESISILDPRLCGLIPAETAAATTANR